MFLPQQYWVSGPPNKSVKWSLDQGYRVNNLITDHFHLWEQGAGNYHMGYTGFDFVRGCAVDAYYTAPEKYPCPEEDRFDKFERHWRNVHYIRQSEGDYFCAQVFHKAGEWLKRNHAHENFYLHLDIFDPHEPWDPPEDILKQFDPRGYAVEGLNRTGARYAPWRETLSESHFHTFRTRYAAKVVLLDRWMGKFFDVMDALDLWRNTLVILTTDHGTFNGDHGRMGKLQTHEFDAKAHIPFILTHPDCGHGERRPQLIQLVDVFPTVLAAVDRPLPEMPDEKSLHGVNLLSVLESPDTHTRDYAPSGMFGKSVSITDGTWTLHQSPVSENQPLHWHGYSLAKFIPYNLGTYERGVRPVFDCDSWPTPTWLNNTADDPNELINLTEQYSDKLRKMQCALKDTLINLQAPQEQFERLGL